MTSTHTPASAVRSTSQDLATLAEWSSGFTLADLPADLLPTIRACVLYGLAVGIATVRVPSAQAICTMADADGEPSGPTTRLLDGRRGATSITAMANAVLLSGRVQGDSHPCGHLGGVAIPVALAVAEHNRLDGENFLASLVVGYETGLRIGRDHAAALSERGFRTTPAYGVFSASAIAARGMGFDPEHARNALAIAANLAAGLREYVNAGTDESPFHAGFAARSGISSALLAATNLRAATSALHGSAGFYSAYGGPNSDHGTRLCTDLGRQFEFSEVTYKPYPACQFLRGSIYTVGQLGQAAAGARLDHLEIRLNPFEADFIGVRYAGPFSASSQTVMSAPFCAGLAWTSGTASYAGLREFEAAEVLDVVRRVEVIGDDQLQRYQTHVRATLADGRVLEDHDDTAADAYRVTWDAAVPAALALCAEVDAPAALVERLVAAVEGIAEAPDVIPVITAVRDIVTATEG